MTRVAVLGDGAAPAQIAAEFALGGCAVLIAAPGPEPMRAAIEDALRMAAQHSLAGPPELERARALIAQDDGSNGAEGRLALIVEALTATPAEKAAAVAALARRHPEALVVSVAEDLSPAELGAAAGIPDRMLGARYGSPPLLMPVVELVACEQTPPRLLDRLAQLLRAIGKRPVLLERESPGLVSGRLEGALLAEAARLVEEGVASPAAVDEVVRESLARDWRLAGPFEGAPLRGRAHGTAARDPLQDRLAALAGSRTASAEQRERALAQALREERAAGRAAPA